MRLHPYLPLLLLTALACEKEDADKEQQVGVPGQLIISLSNATPAALTDMAPTAYAQKIWHISLRGKMTLADGAEVEAEAVIYGNPACSFPTQQVIQPHTDKPEDIEVLFEYIGIDNICRNVGEYLELARDSSLVNADLNAQKYPVPPGVWDRVALNSIGNDAGAPFYKFQAGTMTEAAEVTGTEAGGGITATLPTPIEIAEGDEIELSISYDLSSGVGFGAPGTSDASGGANCYTQTSDNMEYCVNPIEIVPSAQKVP